MCSRARPNVNGVTSRMRPSGSVRRKSTPNISSVISGIFRLRVRITDFVYRNEAKLSHQALDGARSTLDHPRSHFLQETSPLGGELLRRDAHASVRLGIFVHEDDVERALLWRARDVLHLWTVRLDAELLAPVVAGRAGLGVLV